MDGPRLVPAPAPRRLAEVPELTQARIRHAARTNPRLTLEQVAEQCETDAECVVLALWGDDDAHVVDLDPEAA